MSNPYLNKKIIPLKKEPLPLPFNPGRYEQYIWIDLHEQIAELSTRILDFEADPMHHHHKGALMCVPASPGHVFGLTAEYLVQSVVKEIFEHGATYDLTGLSDEIHNHFDTDPNDPDYEYWVEVSAQFFSMIYGIAPQIVSKFFVLLGENSFRQQCRNSDVWWHFLGLYNKQALLGFGLADYSEI